MYRYKLFEREVKILARLRRKAAAVKTLEEMVTSLQDSALDEDKKSSLVLATESLLAGIEEGGETEEGEQKKCPVPQLDSIHPDLSSMSSNLDIRRQRKHKSQDIGGFYTKDLTTCIP